jgi:hypothetical protein
VEKAMKRRLLIVSLAILIAVGILVGLFVAVTRDPGPAMSFNFLDGRKLIARIEEKPGKSAYKTTRDVYSFEADFNGVCTKAEAELLGLGFKNVMLGNQKSNSRQYMLRNNASAERFSVSILDKQRLSSYSTPESSGYSSPERHEYHWRDGWVSIEVTRRRLRSWPPKYLVRRLQMKLRRAASEPSSKKP